MSFLLADMAKTYTAYNIRIILVLTLGSLTFGYAYSVISNTVGQPGFISYFDLGRSTSYSNSITGAVNGIFSAGGTCGALLVGWMCEARGRKQTMNLGAVITVVGSAIQTGSVDVAMFLVARFITGWGIGMMVVLIPIYQAEICQCQSPLPHILLRRLTEPCSSAKCARLPCRSAWYMDCYWIRDCWMGRSRNILFGQSVISVAFSNRSIVPCSLSTALLQSLGPRISTMAYVNSALPSAECINISNVILVLTRNKNDEAWKIISRLHGAADDEDQIYAREEFYQMTQQVQVDASAWDQGGNRQLFSKPSYRKRMWMGFFIQYAAQTTGAMVVYREYPGAGRTKSVMTLTL